MDINGNEDTHLNLDYNMEHIETEGEDVDSNFDRESTKSSDFDEDGVLGELKEEDYESQRDTETPADGIFTKTKKQENEILSIIETVAVRCSSSIDLSRKQLQSFPDELQKLSQIEFMYLEGNEIGFLPDDFFKFFPKLQWLDLRNNGLSRIPTIYLASHSCLRNLLLEGNDIRNLPLELGLVKTLHGLNIAGNPLEFPPEDIIQKGSRFILNFLVQMIEAKNNAKMADLNLELSKEVPDSIDLVSASSDDWNTTASMMDLAKQRQFANHNYSSALVEDQAEPSVFGSKPAELHCLTSFTENRSQHLERLKKAGALGTIERKKSRKNQKMNWKVNPYPSPPPQEYINFKMKEEKQLARVKELKQKTDAILQRRKDDASLRSWRDDAKVLQRQKYHQEMVPGEDFEEIAEGAPFAVEKEMMKVMNKEARMKDDMRKEEEIRRQRAISPATKQRIEVEKQANIRELEKRIKEHTSAMVDRRKQPKGTPQHEMEIAKRELQIVKNLQRDLMKRYQELKAWSAG